jgi:hypothetical protein
MRNQTPPGSIDDVGMFKKFIAHKGKKYKKVLVAIQSDIEGAYAGYVAKTGNLGNVRPMEYVKNKKKALLSCYNNETNTLTSLKESIKGSLKQVDIEKCPYCSLRPPGEFDHYLSKSVFPEFSVLSKNLIWTCAVCNGEKSAACYGARRTLNTYFDPVPDERFLFCELNPTGDTIEFYLRKPASTSPSLFQLLERHFSELRLAQLYLSDAVPKMAEWKNSWGFKLERYSSSEVIEIIAEDFSDDLRGLIQRYGKNYYEVALIEATLSRLDDIVSSL